MRRLSRHSWKNARRVSSREPFDKEAAAQLNEARKPKMDHERLKLEFDLFLPDSGANAMKILVPVKRVVDFTNKCVG